MKKHRTSFERIPVELVKKLAKERDTVERAQNVVVKTAATKSLPSPTTTTAPVSNINQPNKR